VFVRKQILTLLARIDEADPSHTFALEARKTLRRNLTLEDYRALLAQTQRQLSAMSTAVDTPVPSEMSAKDSQNDRHHSSSEKENSEEKTPLLAQLLSTCTEALSFSTSPIKTWTDAEALARSLAPMIGVNNRFFETACSERGSHVTTSALFVTLEKSRGIHNLAGYFRSITLGKHRDQFNPRTALQRMTSFNVHRGGHSTNLFSDPCHSLRT
jgi:replication initiation protein RepC